MFVGRPVCPELHQKQEWHFKTFLTVRSIENDVGEYDLQACHAGVKFQKSLDCYWQLYLCATVQRASASSLKLPTSPPHSHQCFFIRVLLACFTGDLSILFTHIICNLVHTESPKDVWFWVVVWQTWGHIVLCLCN